MPQRGTNAFQKAKHQAHFMIAEKHKTVQKAKFFADKLKKLHKLHPENEYKLVIAKNKAGHEIEHIKLITGKKYKNAKK